MDLANNQIKEAPRELFERDWHVRLDRPLAETGEFAIAGNPLEVPPVEIVEQGKDAVLRYFDALEKGKKKRYQGKLLILGNGDQGKTCVSRALRGLRFRRQNRTAGVEIKPLEFMHPDHPDDEQKKITLYLWDFEGQEINHQSHQFFLTQKSLYLLVFKGREIYPKDDVEYWLDTINARAPKSRVILVATECEKTTPNWPLDQLKTDYADLLTGENWYFTVGCQTGEGIDALLAEIKGAAAAMKYMGIDWPDTYEKAEKAVRKKRAKHITRKKLMALMTKSGISPENAPEVANVFEQHGVITQFCGCPDLEDFVVLNPQWLTKAISVVMEDEELKTKRGDISHDRMRALWEGHKYTGMFATLHNCMKHFELCYDLEELAGRCLIPLHFSSQSPDSIPWSGQLSGLPVRRIEYKIDIHPPAGLMSRFIVKTHRMIVRNSQYEEGVFWNRGVFLAKGEDSLRSEALCAFDNHNRVLSIEARAAFPQNILEYLDGIAGSVFSFYEGLRPIRRYGCIKKDNEQELPCGGRHPEKRVYLALQEDCRLVCEHGDHTVDPYVVAYGFSSFGDRIQPAAAEDVQDIKRMTEVLLSSHRRLEEKTDKLIGVVETASTEQKKLLPEITQRIQQALGDYYKLFKRPKEPTMPSIWGIRPLSEDFKIKNLFKEELAFTPYCECEEQIHRCPDATIFYTFNKNWWVKTAPRVASAVRWVSKGLTLFFAGVPVGLDPAIAEEVKNEVSFLKSLSSAMEIKKPEDFDKHTSDLGIVSKHEERGILDLREAIDGKGLIRAGLELLMEEIAPVQCKAKQWGSLRAARMPDETYRWLCKECRDRLV